MAVVVHCKQGEVQLRHLLLLRYLPTAHLVHLVLMVVAHSRHEASQATHVPVEELTAEGALQSVHWVAEPEQRRQLELHG